MPSKNNILIRLSQSEKTQFGEQDFSSQSRVQQVFSSIWAVESEVNNGGFSQYFLNDSCETAAFVAEGLDTIGAPRTADICRRAIATAFPAGLPPARSAISAAAAHFSDEVLEQLGMLVSFLHIPTTSPICCFPTSRIIPKNSGNFPRPTTDPVGD
jgi:hypothetical protein